MLLAQNPLGRPDAVLLRKIGASDRCRQTVAARAKRCTQCAWQDHLGFWRLARLRGDGPQKGTERSLRSKSWWQRANTCFSLPRNNSQMEQQTTKSDGENETRSDMKAVRSFEAFQSQVLPRDTMLEVEMYLEAYIAKQVMMVNKPDSLRKTELHSRVTSAMCGAREKFSSTKRAQATCSQ